MNFDSGCLSKQQQELTLFFLLDCLKNKTSLVWENVFSVSNQIKPRVCGIGCGHRRPLTGLSGAVGVRGHFTDTVLESKNIYVCLISFWLKPQILYLCTVQVFGRFCFRVVCSFTVWTVNPTEPYWRWHSLKHGVLVCDQVWLKATDEQVLWGYKVLMDCPMSDSQVSGSVSRSRGCRWNAGIFYTCCSLNRCPSQINHHSLRASLCSALAHFWNDF